MLRGIHAIYPPSEFTQHRGGDSVSEKSLIRGYRTREHKKEILVWIFNDQDYTLRLPSLQNINSFTTKTPSKVMEKLAGSLQHASFGIPGMAGLFSPIKDVLKGTIQCDSVSEKSLIRGYRTR